MLKSGASGYLLKDCAFEELVQAIRVVAGGKWVLWSLRAVNDRVTRVALLDKCFVWVDNLCQEHYQMIKLFLYVIGVETTNTATDVLLRIVLQHDKANPGCYQAHNQEIYPAF